MNAREPDQVMEMLEGNYLVLKFFNFRQTMKHCKHLCNVSQFSLALTELQIVPAHHFSPCESCVNV